MNTSSSTRTRSIFVTSRIRPGDSPSSFVCQGLIDFLVSSDPRAQSLRSHLVFMIVPMVNPDGVALGNYHSSLLGFDLNRHWKEPSVCVHPEIYAVKNCLISLDENMEASLDFFVDILATESLRNGLVFGNALQNEENDNKDEIRSLAGQQIENSSPSINLHASEGNCVPSFTKPKQKSPGGIFGLQTLCYTLEVSFFGYMGCNGEIVPYTEELCILLQFSEVRYINIINIPKLHSIWSQFGSHVLRVLPETAFSPKAYAKRSPNGKKPQFVCNQSQSCGIKIETNFRSHHSKVLPCRDETLGNTCRKLWRLGINAIIIHVYDACKIYYA